ncbi:LacI family DNA-binding transcriptional regulator [Deinococcus soli (ex Cha et al. 2016)]|uniref:LacI family transcriptional regulator n=2 Tax=Deinococcus soli (ex Cha et al. 2016) TaxID=1309411 RepID=A0ACC6KHU3_9DEIO|nr:LacI family DNA-binding transcriptional regulator [Deinococcus soli (ex Cha et al. 2016)]MDR6219240.1 LacI family transcriptional regulator [Deinococcus soli (ex Cha et al. 2016)]MDR6329489.1 LacI family transcriptional regulator [Deinococcus soli (ex Cha et al. 2016)]MDR6752149.1 LacI family transcriptional regulator [Deinococcus soli (ex Cha et al. 2016)]
MASIQDVAQLAQVSTATASRALSRPDMVAATTRERVLSAARELGYQPNVIARSLRQGETRTIGVIVTDILNPFHAQLAKGIQDAADRHGYTAFLFNSDEDPAKERRAIDTLRGHLPQGLIIVPTSGARENLAALNGVPIVELDRMSGTPDVTTVTADNSGGATAATRHLISLGHARIGMIVGQQDISTATQRHGAYRAALEAAGLTYDPALVLPGNHREDDGHRAALRLLTLPEHRRPTALFIGNNEMTVGAVLAARALNLRIPEDLSIVGFDDSRWAQTMNPPLTVVAQPTYDLGTCAAEQLIAQLRHPRDGPPQHHQLSTTLIVRHSTSPPHTPAPAHSH